MTCLGTRAITRQRCEQQWYMRGAGEGVCMWYALTATAAWVTPYCSYERGTKTLRAGLATKKGGVSFRLGRSTPEGLNREQPQPMMIRHDHPRLRIPTVVWRMACDNTSQRISTVFWRMACEPLRTRGMTGNTKHSLKACSAYASPTPNQSAALLYSSMDARDASFRHNITNLLSHSCGSPFRRPCERPQSRETELCRHAAHHGLSV